MIRATKIALALSLVAVTVFTVGLSNAAAAEKPTPARSNARSDEVRVFYKRLKVGDLDISYREAGSKSAPTVLLLHGFPTSSQMFRNLIPALADRYHVVAPDYPGYGQSSMPPRDKFAYTFDNLAKVIDEFTEQLGLKKYALYVQDYRRC